VTVANNAFKQTKPALITMARSSLLNAVLCGLTKGVPKGSHTAER
jgi:hypothetical protein